MCRGKGSMNGFTLIELMLAMSLFISILVISTTGFVGINRTFSKGIVRKQLSEAKQQTIEEITRSIRAYGALSVPIQDPPNPGISPYAVCNQAQCFVWNTSSGGGNEKFGLMKTIGIDPDDMTGAIELVDNRFKIDFIDVNKVADAEGLYRVTGVMRIKDDEPFKFESTLANYLLSKNPNGISCKGSSEAGASRNCALEKLDFVVTTVNTKEGD